MESKQLPMKVYHIDGSKVLGWAWLILTAVVGYFTSTTVGVAVAILTGACFTRGAKLSEDRINERAAMPTKTLVGCAAFAVTIAALLLTGIAALLLAFGKQVSAEWITRTVLPPVVGRVSAAVASVIYCLFGNLEPETEDGFLPEDRDE